MNIRFQTNLDAAKPDVNGLNSRVAIMESRKHETPRKGDLILFRFFRGEDQRLYEFHLEVVSVVHDYDDGITEVELHIPSYFVADKRSVGGWTKWFNSHRYGKDSS